MLVAKFKLGQIVATPTLLNKVSETDQMRALNRHARYDWGIITEANRSTTTLLLPGDY